MSDDWENTPCADRPRLPVFPSGLRFFGAWRTVRWFLLLILPVFTSAAGAYLRGRGAGSAVGLLLMGVGWAGMLFVTFCSEVSSSNHGTFYRRREPIRYWLTVGSFGLFYLLFSVVGYFG
jgi:hypothetical protein